jgi:PAS domain-containing protein
MANTAVLEGQSLADIAEYHNDMIDAVGFFWQPAFQQSNPRFAGCTPGEFDKKLAALRFDRVEETEIRSTFALLAAVEAALRIDYLLRVTQRGKDDLSRAFRTLYKQRQERALFGEDLLDLWAEHHPELNRYVSELRAALQFRHWLAHGRYWRRPTNGRFEYFSIYLLAEAILSFPLYRN